MTMQSALFDRRPARRPAVDFRVLDDLSGMAVDGESGDAHALNPVASAVLERCDGTLTVGEIVDEVADIFDAPRDRIAQDVVGFLDELADLGLVHR